MDQRQSPLRHHLAKLPLPVLEGDAVLQDLGAEGTGRRHLGRVGVFWNQDQGGKPGRPGRQRQRLGVVARADRDDSVHRRLALLQPENSVEGAAHLEGTGDLEAFGLEAEARLQVGGQHRCPPHVGPDSLGGRRDLPAVVCEIARLSLVSH